jgi:hypothetical protein
MSKIVSLSVALAKAGGTVLDEYGSSSGELFHYTDTTGLIGILKSQGELWATDVRCMNDTDEFTLGHRFIEQALKDRTAHPSHKLLARLLSHPSYVSPLVFSISFSEDRDLLSQWRAYTDNGAGFSVGFDHASLDTLSFEGKPAIKHMVKVMYDRHRQEECAGRLVESVLNTLAPLANETLTAQDDQFLVMALGLLVPTFAVMCKNPAFSEEREHRVVLRTHQDPLLPAGLGAHPTKPRCSFRAGKYGITPYLPLRFPDEGLTNALTRIVIGPRDPGLDTPDKLRTLLANAGVKGWTTFPIERAIATYR